MPPQPIDSELSALQSALSQWREHRAGSQIPREIATRAVALLDHYRPMVIMRALKLDSRTLRRWRRLYSRSAPAVAVEAASAPAFVALPASAVSGEPATEPDPHSQEPVRLALTLTRHGDNAPISLAGTLTLDQWRQAMTLLHAVSG